MPAKKDMRYELARGQEHSLIENDSGQTYSLATGDQTWDHLDTLLSSLVKVANRRQGGFDPLFNCLESQDAIFVFLKKIFPPLLASGVLQPLVDLNAAVHDKVVGARPPLLDGRMRGLDGSYRLRGEYPEGSFRDDRRNDAPTRPVRLYRYMLEALTLIAFDALLEGHGHGHAVSELQKMLRRFGIRTQDHRPSRPVLVENVVSWRKGVLGNVSRPAAARAYSYNELRQHYDTELRLCSDQAEGRRFAEKTLERVRTHQITDVNSIAVE